MADMVWMIMIIAGASVANTFLKSKTDSSSSKLTIAAKELNISIPHQSKLLNFFQFIWKYEISTITIIIALILITPSH